MRAPSPERIAVLLGVLLALGLSSACGPSAAPLDARAEPDAAPSDAAADAPHAPCSAAAIDVVTGRVVDDGGSPVASARPQLCARLDPDGRLVCLSPPITDAEGRFVIEVPSEVRCMQSAAMRALLPGGSFATSYCPVELGPAAGGALDIASALELFAVERAITPTLGDPTVVREVVLGDVLALEVAPDEVGGAADYARLGAVAIEPSRSCVPSARSLAGLIAAMPEASTSAPFRVRDAALAPGTAVDLHVIGGLGTVLADGTEVGEAELVRFGAGVVGADGWITPDPGVRLPHLGWLGWSAAP